MQVVDTAHIILYKVEDIKYKQTWITPSALWLACLIISNNPINNLIVDIYEHL